MNGTIKYEFSIRPWLFEGSLRWLALKSGLLSTVSYCSDVDNSRKPGKLPGCERDFPGCKALLISPKCF